MSDFYVSLNPMKPSLIFLLLMISLSTLAQENRYLVSGEIRQDSLIIENAHIINQTTGKGTVSNSQGRFKINAQVNDTLFISALTYGNRQVIVSRKHLVDKWISIKMEEERTELDEVMVKQYDNMAKELGLPNAEKKPLNKLERNLNAYSQKSTPVVILQALLFKPGGIDDIYNIVSGNRKRDRKLKALIDADKKKESDNINVIALRERFGDQLFIKDVGIDEEIIDDYIYFCLSKGIMKLYNEGRMIEVIEIFLNNKTAFENSLQSID